MRRHFVALPPDTFASTTTTNARTRPRSALRSRVILGGNRIMVPGSSTTISCGKSYTMAEWLAEGYDAGTTVSDVPPTTEIMAMARAVLRMPPAAAFDEAGGAAPGAAVTRA